MTDTYKELEVLICVCASEIVKNGEASLDLLVTLHEALMDHFESKDRTIH